MGYDVADLERRLDAGEWLRTGEVAALLGQGRTTVHRTLAGGDIRFRRTVGGQRHCNPEDVRRVLDRTREVHGDEPSEGQAATS